MPIEFKPAVNDHTGRILKHAKDIIRDSNKDREAATKLYEYFSSIANYKPKEGEPEEYTLEERKQARNLMASTLKLKQDAKVNALRALEQLISVQNTVFNKKKTSNAKQVPSYEDIAGMDE